jgi:hypothetical protein
MTRNDGHPERPSRHPERGEGSAVRDSLRAADERDAPVFYAVVARARRPRVSAWHPPRAALAVALVLVIGGTLVYRSARPQPLTVPDEVLALSSWRPMTDVLLGTPNRGLLREIPQFERSLLPSVPHLLPEPDSRVRW